MEESRLLIIGNVNVDFIIGPLTSWPEIGTETVLPMSDLRPGGSAGNSALALKGLGIPFTLVSAVGRDRIGSWLARNFGESAESWITIDGPTTVTIGIVHEGGERTFLTTYGHLESFTIDHILPSLDELPAGGGIALLSGVFLSPLLQARYGELIDRLHQSGYSLAVDPGWPSGGWSDAVRRESFEWFSQCRHVLINEKEALALSNEENVTSALAVLADRLPNRCSVVIKNGPDGALIQQGGEVHTIRAPAVNPFDTIGAGDCFNAGYLHAIGENRSPRDAVEAGVRTAAAAITSFPRHYPDAETIGKIFDLAGKGR